MTRIIGVISGKGGVGKTTLVMNLGVELVRMFKKDVTVVDCNISTSHLSLSLGMHWCDVTLNDVLTGDKKVSEAIYSHPTGLKILPASLKAKDVKNVDITKLKDAISHLGGTSDIVILDAAPGLAAEAKVVMEMADEIIFLTTPYITSAVDVIRCVEMMKGMSGVKLGVVLNMVHGDKYELTEREIEQLTEMPVITSIPFDKNILKSLAQKAPLVTQYPKSPASRSIRKLAAEVAGVKYSEKRGFLSFLGI
jgi:cell division ATPase MinD